MQQSQTIIGSGSNPISGKETDMNALDHLMEKWDEVKAAIKKRWGDKITDRDLDKVAGQREQLCHLLVEKCGLPRVEAANREIDTILSGISGV